MLRQNYSRSRNSHRENLRHESFKEKIAPKTEQSPKYFHLTFSSFRGTFPLNSVSPPVHNPNNSDIPDGKKDLSNPRALPWR
jgi:hypothetical protein